MKQQTPHQTAMAAALNAAGIRASADQGAVKAEMLLEEACKRPLSGADRIAHVKGGLLGEAACYIMTNSPFSKFLDQAIGYALAQTMKEMRAAEAERQAQAASAAKKSGPGTGRDPSGRRPVENGQAGLPAEPSLPSPDRSLEMQQASTASEPTTQPPAASPPKRPLTGIAGMVKDEMNAIAAKKSYLDLRIGGKILYNMRVVDALDAANIKQKRGMEQLDADIADIHESIFVRKVCSGVNDQNKPTSHYWPNRFDKELYQMWERARFEAMGLISTKVACHEA